MGLCDTVLKRERLKHIFVQHISITRTQTITLYSARFRQQGRSKDLRNLVPVEFTF